MSWPACLPNRATPWLRCAASSRRRDTQRYRKRGLGLVRKQKNAAADALEPRWGEPELLMNLAFANLHKSSADLQAAKDYAESALALVPYWHYVRDSLLVQIQKA